MELKKTKILYLITQSNMGGAQKYVFDLATNLDKAKFEVMVAAGPVRGTASNGAGGDGELFRRLEEAGVKTFHLKWLKRETINPIADLAGLWEIYQLIKKIQPDVVHLNSSKAGFSGSIAARLVKHYPLSEPRPAGRVEGYRPKVIYTVHGAVFEANFSWLTRKIFLFLEKSSARFKDKVICVSEADRQLWLKYKVASPEKLVTIHNGINLNIDFATKEEARQKLFPAVPQNRNDYQIVGWNGWFYPEKNLKTLIRAANLIFSLPDNLNKKILFVIFGNGPQEKILKSQVSSYKLQDKIIFPGAVPEGARYLKAFDVFVLPSTKEGLPYTILEAMAAGVPIVASRVGGIPEMIINNDNGFLIRPTDYEALSEKILQILENPDLAQRFSAASLAKVKEFSLEKMVLQTQAQYFYNLNSIQ